MSNDLIEISSPGFMHHGLSCVSSIFEKSLVTTADDELKVDRRFSPVVDSGEIVAGEGLNSCNTSSNSSSIGKNSDVSERSSSDDGDDSGETEVQSSYNGSFVNMEALEEVLPMRRGISNFYNGKSKSFASLADASSLSTMKHIAKPENAYTRKRRNLLANHMWDNKNRNSPLRSSNGGISKRPANMSRSTLALAVAMSSSESITTSSDDSNSNSRSPPRLPPLHPQTTTPRNFSPWRSYSVVDLRHCNKGDPKN